MNEPCSLSGPCPEMRRLFGEGCFVERGKIFLGSMRLMSCLGQQCKRAVPDNVVLAWDAKGFIPASVKVRPITPVQLPEPPAWREDNDS